ncbi:hypothetical protein EST38_g3342 [Candolleomyces aberdarensis]|uniref:MARVEL domain-containing protein n=1 Tax=Candolleomyces aberdarensis TaxID=2316362 RepID=A0A4V1Q4L5_9AGAR|nr:hypothetical protein EST38_g3342 [Candolleomyces aberdarensis]
MNEKDTTTRRLSFGVRSVAYGVTFFFLFAMTVALLGLVGNQLHKYGNTYEQYASMEYKNGLGLLLFSVIFSLLILLSHPWLGVGFICVLSFIAAVFFGTGAGVINRTAPFKGTSCNRPADEYPEPWRPYAHECSRIVAIQGLAWALWGLYIFLFFGAVFHKIQFKARPTPEGFYYNKA